MTNGLLLTESRFESLLQAGLNTIAVSLDGFAEQHDAIRRNPLSYVHALQAARMIAASGAVVYDVVTCVTPALMPHLEDFCRHLIENGILHWRIFTIFPVGRAAEDRSLTLSDGEFRQLMEFIRRKRREGRIEVTYACEGFLAGYETEVRDVFYYCSAGVTTASIRVDGAISGCTSIRADYDQGNIYRDDFWDVWTNRFGQFRRRDWMRRDECATCSMFRYCQGGGMHLRDKRKILIPAAAALLAIALFLCIFLPIFLGKGSGGLNPGGNKFAEIAAGDLLVREAGGKIQMDADLVASNGCIEL